MPKEVLAFFKAQKKPYICNPCSSDVPTLFKAKDFLKDLGSKMAKIEEQMEAVNTRVEVLEEKTDYRTSKDFKEAVWEQINVFKADEEEKAFRRSNIIIKGMKEAEATDPIEKKNEDTQRVKAAIRELGIHDPVEIKSLTRLNRPQAWGPQDLRRSKPRLLKVVLGSEDHKHQILKKHREVSDNASAAPEGDTLQIMPDRTFKERQERINLARERDERNTRLAESGCAEKKWIIVRGQLKQITTEQPSGRRLQRDFRGQHASTPQQTSQEGSPRNPGYGNQTLFGGGPASPSRN